MLHASPLPLPPLLGRRLDAAARKALTPEGGPEVDFARPAGEPALTAPDSLSWQVFKNPVALFIGGVAAVILELAEPGVRAGVWEHSSFRRDPVGRLRRTGLAAMVTVYGARSLAERMIAGVVRAHERVSGVTPEGLAYHANDPELLTWVQATANYGFAEAYSRFVRPLSEAEFDRLYAEAAPVARLYGADAAPTTKRALDALLLSMRGRLQASPVVLEFLEIMREAPAFPAALRPAQRMMLRAAVELTPPWLREDLGLTSAHGLQRWEWPMVRAAARLSDRVLLRSSPPAQACLRLGLPIDYLYRR